ncbi:hypothetical protein Taro_017700 [Colocasia esculenta]|uniref:Uncharacterized protein n=1 Tax=Colocasia esculenta TaxID=4460 RepID=A0A843US06_COLES|nr:hypothetical protein [Colocasia esculenta]
MIITSWNLRKRLPFLGSPPSTYASPMIGGAVHLSSQITRFGEEGLSTQSHFCFQSKVGSFMGRWKPASQMERLSIFWIRGERNGRGKTSKSKGERHIRTGERDTWKSGLTPPPSSAAACKRQGEKGGSLLRAPCPRLLLGSAPPSPPLPVAGTAALPQAAVALPQAAAGHPSRRCCSGSPAPDRRKPPAAALLLRRRGPAPSPPRPCSLAAAALLPPPLLLLLGRKEERGREIAKPPSPPCSVSHRAKPGRPQRKEERENRKKERKRGTKAQIRNLKIA